MRETDLYPPVKRFLIANGYEVRSEVEDCDIVALQRDEVLIVELKRAFTLDLVFQGLDRQRLADFVYLAIEAPRRRPRAARWRGIRELCGRLGLGLLAVRPEDLALPVEVICEAAAQPVRNGVRVRKGKARLLNEFHARTGDHNTAGSTQRPLITAYRESALRIAQHLSRTGPSSLRRLRELTNCATAGTILQRNVYGWFNRIDRGVYSLSASGQNALTAYADIVAGWDDSSSSSTMAPS